MAPRRNTLADFWSQVDKTGDPEGCWLWRGCLTTAGYGKIRIANEQHRTHRLAYQLLVGPIPDGLVLDHLCRVRHCCNPAHLEPVTNHENILRGVSPSARNARASQCVAGHEFTEANTRIIAASGERRCQTCSRQRNRDIVARRRIEIVADPSLAIHGRPATYTGWGCRCDDCKVAWSNYMSEYHQRRGLRLRRSA